MLKRGTNKHSKGSLQTALNPLSNRNNNVNESFNASSIPQYPSATEYTIELKTNLKPPSKLTTKKTPEVMISIGSPKENIENPRIYNENSPMILARKQSSNKIIPTSPIRSYCREVKAIKAPEKNIPREYNSNDDIELAQRIAKIQNELNKIGIFEPRSPTSAGGHIQSKYSGFIDIITQLKEVVDKLQLRDILQKQEIGNLRKTNEKLKNNLVVMEQKLKTQRDRRDTGFLSPTRLESRILNAKRNSRDVVKLKLEEKAHSFAKSVLSSPSHKTFDLLDHKSKILEGEMSTERHAKNEKISKSNSLSTAKLPPSITNSQAVSISNLTLETRTKEFDPKQTTEIDSLVQIKTVTMSDLDNLGGTLSTHQPASHNSICVYESQNTKDSKTSILLDPLQSLSRRDRSIADRKGPSPEPVTPNCLHLKHQKSQGSSSAISFPKTSFVPSKVRRDELRIRVNDKGLGSRSLSQSRYERHRDSDCLSGTFSPTASKVMKQYKHYLNEPHISPLQSESKSINMDFGGQYLNNTSKNGDDTRNLSVNNLNSPNRKGSTQPFLVDDLSKTIIPEEIRLDDFKNKQTPEEEKVTLFNRCLKLTMGLSSTVLDDNQCKRVPDIGMKILTPPHKASSPNMKKSSGLGIAVRK